MSEAADWLRFATEDLQVAEWALSSRIYNQVCFHAQQCVEKALKAWLIHHHLVSPRAHQMSALLGVAPRPLPFSAEVEEGVVGLDRFYIPTRYPDALPGMLPEGLPSAADADEALTLARQVFTAVSESIERSQA
ncbi:MAG TPA: HEPN domain-containing protein [Anaerolineae bacterium]|nr:HEPN domain-containing protein [Anaerolineae bacterium]